MKISLITVCYNSAAVIRTALDSVFAQSTPAGLELEYLVIDGGSTDGTVEILKEYATRPVSEHRMLGSTPISFRYISERDAGMYDALNKGIKLSSGDIIGWLNADDVLASDDILSRISSAFSSDPTLDGTYADIRFVRDTSVGQVAPEGRKVRAKCAEEASLRREGREATAKPPPRAREAQVGAAELAEAPEEELSALQALRTLPTSRYCSGKWFRSWMFRFGTQTAHPSTFFRRSAFDHWGFYSLDYGMFGDFELLCRFIWRHRAKMRYLPLCTTVMRSGGASTNGWRTTLKINRTDLRALKANGCHSNLLFLYSRYLFKIWGFLFK